MKLLALALMLPALFVFGCNKEEPTSSETTTTTASTAGETTPPADATPKEEPAPAEEQKPETPRKLVGGNMKDGENVAVMETSAGTIVLRFFPKVAPKTVENFL